MIDTAVKVNGSEYNDVKRIRVSKAISDNEASSSFSLLYDSPFGRHKNDFSVGQEIDIFAGNGAVKGLNAMWRMNEGSGLFINDSIGSVTGSLIGSCSFVAGYQSYALTLPGQSGGFVELGSASHLRPSGALSIAMWYNPPALNGSLNTLVINQNPDNGVGSRHGYFLGYNTQNDIKRFWFQLGFDTSNAVFTGSMVLTDGQWNHIVATYDGTRARGYVNGVITGSSAVMGSQIQYSGTQTLRLGATHVYNDFFGSGIIDDLRIYNKALSQAEVSNLYRAGSSAFDTLLFKGFIENVDFTGKETQQQVGLRGRDYTALMQDNTVEPVVYTNMEVGSIVRDIMTSNLPEITTTHVGSTLTTLKRIAFKNVSVYEAIQQLAGLSAQSFFIDNNRDLHLEPSANVSSNQTFTSGNVIRMRFDNTREGMANKVWVYGDRQLSNFEERFAMTGGSVVTLLNKPHHTRVEYLGSTLKGGIYQLTTIPTSGPDFLVSFEDRQIIFQSGNALGYNSIPPNGGSIVVGYDREVPIVKYGENRLAITLYKPKTLVINDKAIRDPITAEDILKRQLEFSDPLKNVEVDINGWYEFMPGQTCAVKLDDFSIDEPTLPIVEGIYNFDEESVQSEDVITLRIDRREIDITAKIRDMNKRLELLESQDRQDTDIITRIEQGVGSALVVGSYWELRTRSATGSVMIWGNPRYDTWGTDVWGTDADAFGPRSVVLSGGYSY